MSYKNKLSQTFGKPQNTPPAQRPKPPVIREQDEDDDNIAASLTAHFKSLLRDYLADHPEAEVKTSGHAVAGTRLQFITVEAPNKPAITFALGGGAEPSLMAKIGGGAYAEVNDDEQLRTLFANWGQQRPRARRRPAAPAEAEPGEAGPARPLRPKFDVNAPLQDVAKSKFFPHQAYLSSKNIPGRQVSKGKPFAITIHARDVDFPDEIFSSQDLHNMAGGKPKYMGWIGGSIEGTTMYIDEVQSDLMQRTLEMTDQTTYNAKVAKEKEQTNQELQSTRRELAILRTQTKYAPAADRFRLVKKLEDLSTKLNQLENHSQRHFKLSNFASYKSRVENTFKNWIQAFYHAAFNYARKADITDVFVISSDRIGKIWAKAAGKDEDETSIYFRAYDKIAQNLGGQREGDWWHLKLADIPQMEAASIRDVARTISEDGGRVLKEGADGDIVARWLSHAGYTVQEIAGKEPYGDYKRFDMVVVRPDPEHPQHWQTVQQHDGLSSEDLHRQISLLQQQSADEPVDMDPSAAEELTRDAALFISAGRVVDGVPYGIVIWSLDSPEMQFGDDDVEEDETSDEDLFGLSQDEVQRLWER